MVGVFIWFLSGALGETCETCETALRPSGKDMAARVVSGKKIPHVYFPIRVESERVGFNAFARKGAAFCSEYDWGFHGFLWFVFCDGSKLRQCRIVCKNYFDLFSDRLRTCPPLHYPSERAVPNLNVKNTTSGWSRTRLALAR
jgi:hypothetical protein